MNPDSVEFKLLGYWYLAHELYGVQVPVASRTLFDEIVQRMAEPNRKYHTASHLVQVCHAFVQLWGGDEGIKQPGEGLFALVLHDVIYEIGRPDNETLSADFALEKLPGLELDAGAVELIAEIIRLTADHKYDGTNETIKACLDADLSILGMEPSRYLEYAAMVRQEYGQFSDEEWRSGRSAFLRNALTSQIYLTDNAREKYLDQARRNMESELAALQA